MNRKLLNSIRNSCKTKRQKLAFNELIKSFSNSSDDGAAIAAAVKTLLYDNINYSSELKVHNLKPSMPEKDIFNLAKGFINSGIIELE